ncbi:HAD family hydrolase [Haloactinomyces albus]|uniref:Phosphoglycolate phosphatase-like HAD superfamily hydrolase n=1 Tax=Haloactinomyces albus TaxID=1352928 RepID=A0AAE3ZGM8_9ACTN|nr:HAD family hydrolase [Haloactinomyces albus]MDR7302842.1 phosphoglycolate phosphatase-like HAD superfamily hydrolase [Haloactinomyces albus]
MVADGNRAVVLGWNGTLIDGPGDRRARLVPGTSEMLTGARAAAIPVIVVTSVELAVVARDARRLGIGGLLSMVIADVEEPVAELAAVNHDFPRLACVSGVDSEIVAARRAGVVAFGYSGGLHSGSHLRAAGAEAVVARFDRGLALRVTANRLFAVQGHA